MNDTSTFPIRARLTRLLSHPATSVVSIVTLTLLTILLALNANGYLVFILALFAMNVTVGVGLNILLGLSGQISFGHVGFFAIGAYTTAIMVLAGFDYWLAFLVSGVLSALAGMLLAMPALRVAGPYLAMMTIAFAFIVEHAAIELRHLTGGHNGLMGFPALELGGRMFFETEVAICAAVLAGVSLLFFLRLSRGRWGTAMRAVADSEVAAQSIGLNPFAIKTVAFVLSALLTGLAGALFTPLQMFISPGSFPFFQSILFLLAVIVGGTGRLFGPVVGSLIVVLLPEVLSGLAEYRLLIFGGIMLGVLLLAPKGVVGGLMQYINFEDPTPAKSSGKEPAALLGGGDAAPRGLKITDLGINFGGVQAAKNVSFTAPPGRVTSVIGPNGAGKTTVLNMVSGFYKPDSGRIEMDRDLAGNTAFQMARSGIARTYQTTQLFEDLSVRDNILIALGTGHLGWLLGGAPGDDQIAITEDLLAFVGYKGPVARRAGDLPHVDKRLVEIARALATRPAVLLLDEPAAGLMYSDKEALTALIRKIAETGVAVVLVEHDMSMIMSISDEIVVLDAGVPIKTGVPSEVQNDADVRRAYLGDSAYQGRKRVGEWKHGGKKEVLSTRGLTAGYGAAAALEAVDVSVEPGEMVAVLGANGAGKSTMMRALSGLHRPVSGAILLDLAPIDELQAHQIAQAGLALVPEGRQVFPLMSVRDNILMGAYTRRDDLDREAEIDALLARFPRLRDRIDAPAGVLSGGEQQMLAIARGLIANPRILLLDEPSLGLAPSIIAELYDVLADLRDEGVTVLLVDQMATLALTIADRAYVLESGHVVKSGLSADLQKDSSIEKAYLGSDVAAE